MPSNGPHVRLSPDSQQILYRSTKGFLFVHKANCSGGSFRLANGVDEGIDWRAD